MCNAVDQVTLPGFEHLRSYVDDWGSAARTLSITAAAIAESVACGAARKQALIASTGQQCGDEGTSSASSPPLPAPPTQLLPPAALKPGRVFIVANLSGAYYSLLDLLSAHKFDFRVDNLMHVGNLVAPPAALLPQPPASAEAAPYGAAAAASMPRICRNSTSVLKLVRRHSARGPMGAHECLTLLAAAAANRQREAEEAARRRLLQQRGAAGTSALTMQLAAAAAPVPTAAPPRTAAAAAAVGARWGCGGSGSDSDSDSDSDLGEDACGSQMVTAPPTPSRRQERDGRCSTCSSACSPSSSLSPAAPCGGGGGAAAAAAAAGPGRPALDNLDLVHLLGLPARVVLESYGVVLQHAGPGPEEGGAEAAAGRYHVIFSHRRSGGAAPTAAAAAAACTGLSCPRPVLRCAVLPPLRSLRRSSPGFAAKLAAGAAPSRQELLLELLEQPLSELDVGQLLTSSS